jgi:uncharacterized protein (TIGR03435 family)
MRAQLFGCVVLAAAATAHLLAQAPAPAPGPHFEVVVIKPVGPDPAGSGWGLQPGGRFRATSVTVRNLIATAFYEPGPPPVSFPPDRILGGPAWLGTDRFNIEARTDATLAAASPLMGTPLGNALIRSLLEDRFKLQTHREARDFSVYALTTAKPDGTLGPKLKRATFDCQALARDRAAGRLPSTPPIPGQTPCSVKNGPGVVQGVAVPMFAVVGAIRQGLGGAEVIDQTGIAGAVDVDLHFTIQPQAGLSADPSAASLPDGDTVFTAVQEQLGLKLDSRKEPRPVIVIDHVERPTED